MNIDNKKLSTALLKGNYLTEDVLKKAEADISKSKKTLFEYLLDENLLSKDIMGHNIYVR